MTDEQKTLKEQETAGSACSAEVRRRPKFGEWMRGIYASERNPHRDGMYVETIVRRGRFNPGTHYRLTDGKGDFWEYPAEMTIYIDA